MIGFVLSGGASLGAVQVGMLQALHDASIRPDFLVGTSVGALNAAWVCAGSSASSLDTLADVWRSLRRSQVFPAGPRGVLGLLGRRDAFVDPSGLRRLLERHLPYERVEAASVPLHVVVTDVLSGRDVLLSSGPLVDVILASAAIPGVFPPVRIRDRWFMDGGVVNNAGVSHAIGLGASTIYVLPTGWSCALERPPSSAVGMAMHGLAVLVQHRLADDVEHYASEVDLRVVPPPCPITVGPSDFAHADELIAAGRQSTTVWLAGQGGDAARLLRPHEHTHLPPTSHRRASPAPLRRR